MAAKSAPAGRPRTRASGVRMRSSAVASSIATDRSAGRGVGASWQRPVGFAAVTSVETPTTACGCPQAEQRPHPHGDRAPGTRLPDRGHGGARASRRDAPRRAVRSVAMPSEYPTGPAGVSGTRASARTRSGSAVVRVRPARSAAASRQCARASARHQRTHRRGASRGHRADPRRRDHREFRRRNR